MARKETAFEPTVQRTMDTEEDQVAAVDPDSSKATDVAQDGPSLVDGHGEIVEEVPGIDPESDMTPLADPGDLSAFGRSSMLPDDIGVGDDAGFDGPVDPGTDLGSTLLDDLTGDLSDPSDGFGGMSDGSGSGVLDDQRGFAMDAESDDGPSYNDGISFEDDPLHATSESSTLFESYGTLVEDAALAYEGGDEALGDSILEIAAETFSAAVETRAEEIRDAIDVIQAPSQAPSGTHSMPAPDDGTGGDPDESDFIGDRGDVDPAPEAEDQDGTGALDTVAAGQGAVDFDPELDDAGGVEVPDMERLGTGAIDPLDAESNLLGDDTGDLADMAAEADVGDIEFELDDSLVDADIGEDV